jgi:hypothetical protein
MAPGRLLRGLVTTDSEASHHLRVRLHGRRARRLLGDDAQPNRGRHRFPTRGLLVGQGAYLIGGVLTGPLFGWFGYRWRTRRDWRSALIAALVVCCEPVAHAAVGASVSFDGVWEAEVIAGLVMALYVIAATRLRTTG